MRKTKRVLVYANLILALGNGLAPIAPIVQIAPNQAVIVGTVFRTSSIMRPIDSNAGLSKKPVIARFIEDRPPKIAFSKSEKNQVSDLSIKYESNLISDDEFITGIINLRGGFGDWPDDWKEWIEGAAGLVTIALLLRFFIPNYLVDGFQPPANQNLEAIFRRNAEILGHLPHHAEVCQHLFADSQGGNNFGNENDNALMGENEDNSLSTFERYGADLESERILNMDVAYKEFQVRMKKVSLNYPPGKKADFLERLEKCSKERFIDLATVRGESNISIVLEVETILQSEFEGMHKSDSMTRMTPAEDAAKNRLDGRFRGGPNSLNGNYTDFDIKRPVSGETLKHQDNQRKVSGAKNTNTLSVYTQGENIGLSSIAQKYKHCNSTIIEKPDNPLKVKHIINLLELPSNEKKILQEGVKEGAKKALATIKNVKKESISDEEALEGISFLNQEITLERINPVLDDQN